MINNNHDCSDSVFYLSLHEISQSFGVTSNAIMDIIDEGIVTAFVDETNEWHVNQQAIYRIRTVLQLNKDLGINTAGAGLVLDLLQEIKQLRLLLQSTHQL